MPADGVGVKPQLPATAAVTIAAAIGAAAGLLELAALALRWWLLHKPPFTSPQVVWTAPLVDALLAAALTALLLGLGRLLRPLRSPRLLLAAPLFLGVCSVAATSGWLAAWAVVLLAGGVAWELARRLAAAPPARLRRWSRRALSAAATLAILLAGLVNGVHLWRERAPAQAPAPPAGAPNVLLLVLDAVRAPSLSLYGYARPTTPELARVARGGVVFEQAFANAPWTLPSHASLFTGREAYEVSVGWTRPWQDEYRTVAEEFSAHGYRTAGFVGNLWYADAQHGLARGFQHYEDWAITPGTVLAGSALVRKLLDPDQPVGRVLGIRNMLWHKHARSLDADFLRWASDAPGPFFAFINYVDAHDPYRPPARFEGSFGSRQGAPGWRQRLSAVLAGRRAWDLGPEEARRAQALYEESIRGLDASVGELIGTLGRRGLLERTVVVVTSDHGEEFGTHGHFTHGSDLYLPALHVPLVILGPGVPVGRRVRETVSLRDVAATMLDLAGIRGEAGLPGRSLAGTWRRAPAAADSARGEVVVSALEGPGGGRSLSVLAPPYHLIRGGAGQVELYRVDLDPEERRNLAGEPAQREVVAGLNALLPRWSSPAGAVRAEPVARR